MELKPCAKSETVTYTVYPEHLKEFLAGNNDELSALVANIFECRDVTIPIVLRGIICAMLGVPNNDKVAINTKISGNRNDSWCVGVTTYTREDDE